MRSPSAEPRRHRCARTGLAEAGAQLCARLDIRADFRTIEGVTRTWQVGYVDVAAGAAFRVVATFPTQEGDLGRVTADLVGRTPPFALLVPTRRHLSPTAVAALSREGCDVAVLDEVIKFGAPGQLICAASPRTVFSRTWAATAPADAGGKRAWVLPADARWEEMRFEFEAEEMLRVTFRGETQRFEPIDLKMRDERKKRPNLQWTQLQGLARNRGLLNWIKPSQSAKAKKQKQALSDRLRAAFGIADDPIVWDARQRAYRALFKISGDVLGQRR